MTTLIFHKVDSSKVCARVIGFLALHFIRWTTQFCWQCWRTDSSLRKACLIGSGHTWQVALSALVLQLDGQNQLNSLAESHKDLSWGRLSSSHTRKISTTPSTVTLRLWVCLTPLWRHCSEYFTLPLGLSWTCNHKTMSQLHCRHCTSYQCINVLHIRCAWCMVLPLVIIQFIY